MYQDETPEAARERRIERTMGRCVHYTGTSEATCAAGVNLAGLVGGVTPGWALRLPCLASNAHAVACEHCRYPNRQEAEAKEALRDEQVELRREDMRCIAAIRGDVPDNTPVTVFLCEVCPREARFGTRDAAAMKTHWQEAHQVGVVQVSSQFRVRAIAHLDGANWSQNDDRLFFQNGQPACIRSSRFPRRGRGY